MSHKQLPASARSRRGRDRNASAVHFHLVQCEEDVWQAFMDGHRAPLSDHVPLDRALKVVSELAAICPHSSLEIHAERAVRN